MVRFECLVCGWPHNKNEEIEVWWDTEGEDPYECPKCGRICSLISTEIPSTPKIKFKRRLHIMKTRFDSNKTWITGKNETVSIAKMETSHILNILKMFKQKPFLTLTMIIDDIEKYSGPDNQAFTYKEVKDVRKESRNNASKMTQDELVDFAMKSTLGLAMRFELMNRGIDVDSVLSLIDKLPVYESAWDLVK